MAASCERTPRFLDMHERYRPQSTRAAKVVRTTFRATSRTAQHSTKQVSSDNYLKFLQHKVAAAAAAAQMNIIIAIITIIIIAVSCPTAKEPSHPALQPRLQSTLVGIDAKIYISAITRPT